MKKFLDILYLVFVNLKVVNESDIFLPVMQESTSRK